MRYTLGLYCLAVFSTFQLLAAVSTEPDQRWITYSTRARTVSNAVESLRTVTEISLQNEQLTQYGASFQDLTVEVTPETASRLHVKITPTGEQRWEVPESIVPRPGPDAKLSSADVLYQLQQLDSNSPFALTVTRKSTGQPIFDTTGHRLLFKDQYLELSTSIPADADLYGLGEVSLPTGFLLPRDGTNITMWAKDQPSAVPNSNLYGSHPFYLQVNKDGSSHGVLLLNSNGMDVQLNPTSLTYRVIGGVFEFYFFLGPSPEQVIRQYHAAIGKPAMPPYWSLGLHQSKWGYANLSVAEAVVANYSAAGVPLEVFISDIDYQNNRFRSMEFDPVRYPVDKTRAFVDRMHSNGQHWMCLVNPGIAAAKGFRAYEEGARDGVFIKNIEGNDYLGQVWPGMAVYPDYLSNPQAGEWLQKQLGIFHKQVPWSGLWLDMNEASNFCAGAVCKPDPNNKTAMYWLMMQTPKDGNVGALGDALVTCQMTCEQPAASNQLAHPPYKIQGEDISHKSISPTAVHADGATEYDAHNLFGTAMAKVHHEAAIAVTGKRPFLLSRSTFPGAGRYVAHWTGDNAANWENLYWSIAGILNTNMWGISMVGADICGFFDTKYAGPGAADPWQWSGALSDTEYQQLCSRWASAGAFYPYSRNHMAWNARNHEFYRWPEVAASARKAYGLRYRLLTYLYSSLFVAHSSGGTVARPLLFTDPTDLLARNATQQWMLGEAVLVSPVITPDTTLIQPHFTKGTWYSAWDYSSFTVSQGQAVQLSVPMGDIAVHYRGGSIIPMQQYAPVTRSVRFSPITLVVTLPSNTAGETADGVVPPYYLDEVCSAAYASHADQKVSCGVLFMDSPEDEPTVTADNSVQVWYVAVTTADGTSGTISSVVVSNAADVADKLRIKEVVIAGVQVGEAPSNTKVTIGGESADGEAGASLDAAGVLKLSGLELAVGRPLDVKWSVSNA